MPVARVMSPYRKNRGNHAVGATAVPKDLDVTASRTGRRVFLHVVNTSRPRDIPAVVAVDGVKRAAARKR